MSDADEDAEDAAEPEEPAVELGEQTPVEGAPLARVVSRLSFPLQKSEIDRREGTTVVRTPDGARALGDVLDEVEVTYFQSSDEFLTVVRDEAIGTGPVPTE